MNTKTIFRLLVACLLLAAIPAVVIAAGQEGDSDRPAPAPLTVPHSVPTEPFNEAEGSQAQPNDDNPRHAIETECGWFWYGTLDEPGDVDYYKFYGLRGESFAAMVHAFEWGTGIDPTLTLYGTNGKNELQYVDDYDSLDPIIHVTLRDEGWYYLAVRGFADAFVGDYYFTVDKPLYLSTNGSGSVDGIRYKNGDVMVYQSCGSYWDFFLRAESLGLKGDINGFALLPDRSALAVFGSNQTFFGDQVTPQDIAYCWLFDVGWDAAWDCFPLFDGSDVGLNTSGEKIESIAVSPWGTILMSFRSKANVASYPGPVQNEDVLEFYPYQYGPDTQGDWYWWFDGSDQGLTAAKTEGLWLNSFWWDLYQSYGQKVTLPNGVVLETEDIGACYQWSIGSDTFCGNWWEAFDGTDARLKTNTVIDAIDLGSSTYLYFPSSYPAPPPPNRMHK